MTCRTDVDTVEYRKKTHFHFNVSNTDYEILKTIYDFYKLASKRDGVSVSQRVRNALKKDFESISEEEKNKVYKEANIPVKKKIKIPAIDKFVEEGINGCKSLVESVKKGLISVEQGTNIVLGARVINQEIENTRNLTSILPMIETKRDTLKKKRKFTWFKNKMSDVLEEFAPVERKYTTPPTSIYENTDEWEEVIPPDESLIRLNRLKNR